MKVIGNKPAAIRDWIMQFKAARIAAYSATWLVIVPILFPFYLGGLYVVALKDATSEAIDTIIADYRTFARLLAQEWIEK